jgi:hypothetical protein
MKGKGYERVLLFIACTVTALWALTVVVQIIFPNHPIPAAVNNIMMIVATSFFAGSLASNVRSKNGNGNNPKKDGDE